MESFGGDLDKLFQRGGRVTGLETHYADLDDMTSGLQKSDLIIIAARPSMGKTAFAINIAENAAVQGGKSRRRLFAGNVQGGPAQPHVVFAGPVDAHQMRTGFLAREDIGKLRTALDRLIQAPLYIDDTPGISLTELRAKARRKARDKDGLDLIVVDYLQLMSASAPGGRRYENRTQEVSAISRGLKAHCQGTRSPGHRALAAQPRPGDSRQRHRAQTQRSPRVRLHRAGRRHRHVHLSPRILRPQNPELEGKAKIIVAKQRNGPTDTIQLAFLKGSTRFETLARNDWLRE